MSALASIVALVALGTYVACGAFAFFYFAARRRIVKRLIAWNPNVVDALLTYPSIASRIGAPQIVALACVGGLGMIALLLFYARCAKETSDDQGHQRVSQHRNQGTHR